MTAAQEKLEFETQWAARLLARNRRSMMIVLLFNAALYPLFGVLDYFVAPREWLWLLLSTRLLVGLVTVAMFRIIRRPLFERHANLFSSAYQVLISWGISLMTFFLGGLGSSYYAGLSLVRLGAGLWFIWPRKVV